MTKLRCAIYARFSSEKQSASSITDQVRKCREYAQTHGWDVLSEHIYSDEAISGATAERAGLKKLLAAAESKADPFDAILVDDSSRLSPSQADSFNLKDRMAFARVRLQVDEVQAKAIRKIFSLYASGRSIKSTTIQMNADKMASPIPRAGRQHSWAPSSIRGILQNERYRGVVVWARTKKIRNPQTGKKIQRPTEKSIRVDMPEQRIFREVVARCARASCLRKSQVGSARSQGWNDEFACRVQPIHFQRPLEVWSVRRQFCSD